MLKVQRCEQRWSLQPGKNKHRLVKTLNPKSIAVMEGHQEVKEISLINLTAHLFLFVSLFALVLSSNLILISVNADELHLEVEKLVDRNLNKSGINVGDDVTVLLKFTNPFGKEIPVKIADKNVIGNNGLDIQCLEYTVPAGDVVTIAYDPIRPYQGGDFVLPPAKVTYANPETGKPEEIESNSIEIRVNESANQNQNQNVPLQSQPAQSQGITTIYQCNGVSMRSVSYSSSSSSFNINIGGQKIQQNPQNSQNQHGVVQSPQTNVQNNQLNQNTNVLKKELEEKKRMEKEFQENVKANRDIQKMMEKFNQSGYSLTNQSFNPSNSNTGTFELNYQKPGGESATIKGELDEGKLKNLASLTSEDKERIMEALENDVTFRNLELVLKEKGYNRSQPVFTLASRNHTYVEVPYVNEKGEVTKITAEYINGSVKNVSLEKEEEGAGNYWWYLFLLPLFGVLGYFSKTLLERLNRGPVGTEAETMYEMKQPYNYLKETKEMLDLAEAMYENGEVKKAFENVSKAIRVYYANKIGLNMEITNKELLENYRMIYGEQEAFNEIMECLDICTSVEFAKYTPELSHFKRALEIGRKHVK